MKIPDCYDPVVQEEARQLAYDARMMRRPLCQGCGRRIWTDTYLKLDGICYCQQCVDNNTSDTSEDFDN